MKNILITGCSRGLGAVIAKQLLKQKQKGNVIPHFRKIGSYIDYGETPNAILGDLNEKTTREQITECLQEHDINVFINNASVHKQDLLTDHSEEDIIKIINTNLTSQILIIRRVYDWFKKRGSGLVINVNSIAGLQPAPKETIYSATKHGLKGFSQSLQVESMNSDIKIVDIYPGAMMTDMTLSRKDYNQLIKPEEVSNIICDVVMNKNTTSLTTEIVIRKFISKGTVI